MKQNYIFWYLCVISTCAFILLSTGLFYRQSFFTDNNRLSVVCTTTLIADAVKILGGEYVTVACLMGPGVDPHLYRACESDIHKLSSARLIFYNGLHLEGKMSEIFQTMDSLFEQRVIAVSDAINKRELIAVAEGVYDPHIWHDVTLWKQVILFVGNKLAQVDPAHMAYYSDNASRFAEQLDQLHKWIHSQVDWLLQEQRILVTAHDAFSYFGRCYGIAVVGLQGMSTEAQVGTKDIQNLADYMVLHKIPALFVETSVPERTLMAVKQAVIAKGWSVEFGEQLYSDALGLKDSNAETYIDMMRCNVNAIIKALRNKKHE